MIMKASWVKRIFKSDEGWTAIQNLYGLNMIYTYGDVFLEKKSFCSTSWREVLETVHFIYKN